MKNENLNNKKIEAKTMFALDRCISAPHPEMARNTDADEPCDDSRG